MMTRASFAALAAAALTGCAIPVEVPAIREEPKVSTPPVVLTPQTSVTNGPAPAFSSMPAAPSPDTAEAAARPVKPLSAAPARKIGGTPTKQKTRKPCNCPK